MCVLSVSRIYYKYKLDMPNTKSQGAKQRDNRGGLILIRKPSKRESKWKSKTGTVEVFVARPMTVVESIVSLREKGEVCCENWAKTQTNEKDLG